ncbi:MAG: hypothetical protein SFU53_13750 [Terrimicrobiaceae bacterium]|nr:hypothetical protein [Terrimicrobiaceae bacterium]
MKWRVRESEVSRNADPVSRIGAAFVLSSMGARGWIRDDGATAELGLNKADLTLALPAAATLEQRANNEAEAKRKAAIPEF